MDELLHHCLRELSFDGDLGCDVSRLRDFIVEFYQHTGTPQNPDDAFCAFVWSLVVQQPTVRVGVVPPGITSEVWVAPQTSAKRKAKAKGQEHIETKPTELDFVPDAKNRTLDDLRREYGDNLRIAVDPDAIYAAITGSHIRFPKLSPMVYSALQIITRGRDSGITVVGLGQKSKYDQKTCFYLVRQLTELDLVVKVRRGGVGTHFCIHKYFFDRSPSWKAIRDEEFRAEGSHKILESREMEPLGGEDDSSANVYSLDFTPIDARHLSSLPLIRARVVKLLKASRNQMHASNNMLITLGFSNPTKTDRRFFQSRIREMILQGLIEKVVVPSNRKKSAGASVKCFRLVTEGQNKRVDEDGIVVQSQDGEEDEKDIDESSGVKMNITIHKQIIDFLEESDVTGMTLNELSAALCHFDKRTIELLLTRAEKYPPPSHLGDLGIAGLMETSGRERRHRYYTIASYRKLVEKENLDNSTVVHAEVDLSEVGGFASVDPTLFYDKQISLFEYQDIFKDKEREKTGKIRKHPLKNPILPDGSVKQGRPRKYPVGEDPKSLRKANKRKRDDTVEKTVRTQPTKKRRIVTLDATSAPPTADNAISSPSLEREIRSWTSQPGLEADEADAEEFFKKRGRLAKDKSLAEKISGITYQISRKRGRPSKPSSTLNNDNEEPTRPQKRGRPLRARTDVNGVYELSVNIIDKEAQSVTGAREDPDLDDPTPEPPSDKANPQLDILHLSRDSTVAAGAEVISSPPSISQMGGSTDENPVEPILTMSILLNADNASKSQTAPVPYRDPILQAVRDSPPLSSQDGVPIDPILLVDILENTQRILHGPLVTPSTKMPVTSSFATKSAPNPSDLPYNPKLPAPAKASGESSEVGLGEGKSQRPRGTRVNVSHLRRENELYRVIENMGGIVNIQTKEFFEEHTALLETLTRAGEATSAPIGTRTDKRTAATAFNNMELRGRIKQLKTTILTHTGVRRPACIVYLPNIEQEKLNAFLADLALGVHPSPPQQGNFVKIDERIEYGADPTSIARGALPLQLLQMEQPGTDKKERWSKNLARADQLFSYDDSVIREVLLTERTTLGQLYGFIVGKVMRTREFHLSTLDAFEKGNTSSNIISHEHRIIDLSFFCHDISLSLYCSLISSLCHDSELTQFLTTEEGRQTLVRDLPPNLKNLLQIGRSRARSRFLDILETLRALKLVTPLQASSSETSWISCLPIDNRPSSFVPASLDGWTVSTPMAAPVYWHFNDIAPLHVWAVSETTPPFWQDVSVTSRTQALNYWQLFQRACTGVDSIVLPDSVSVTGPPSAGLSVARSLRRSVSWNADYTLTWHQMQYLKQFTEPYTAKTPLEDEDEGQARIKKISWVISAPQRSIVAYYTGVRERLTREVEKARRKADHQAVDRRAKRAATVKASLAKKAAEARVQREEEWEGIILRLHPAPLDGAATVRLRRVRTRFLQAVLAKDIERWEAEITDALKEADIATKKILKVNNKPVFTRSAPVPFTVPLPNAPNPPEKSIEMLIAQQGPPIVHSQGAKRKRRGKNAETLTSPEVKPKGLRRHRFQWNRDYEELARDASAIIKARCRNLSRLDWGAFEQVFPAVPRNTVRQRLAHIKETPGNEAYLSRLEDRWYDLWMQHRNTPLLPDDDPTSTSNFNLIKHIEFLRKHVDKNALRVGFVQPREAAGITIPVTTAQLSVEYDIIETRPTAPPWDFMWNAVVEEGREKRMMRQSFTKRNEVPSVGESLPEELSLAESAIKMTLGTPNEHYDSDLASVLLHGLGEHEISVATRNLLNRGVLSKLVRDPTKQKPGRQLKISEMQVFIYHQ
ncbi:hypothetical protein BDZ94DRAFT_1270875 [Collybia nuda]|uniref:Transcription factor tau subunit sfc3 n=1 Tax=Collybia nuda TaxID=64659 RepID=A0A9P6CAD9_9AGAR|nr:hypothetical protein BDZ94DRAFT_1270875 [Collybia nuda]